MQLPYPSIKHSTFCNDLNRIDKKRSLRLITANDIPMLHLISAKNKSSIEYYLQQDKAFQLSQYLDEQAIVLDSEVGDEGTGWNILHLCMKYNSYRCLEFCLKSHYQNYPNEYEALVNSKTLEGLTLLMVAVLNQSHESMQILFHYGGIDMYAIDVQKRTAYEMALSHKNDNAIGLIIKQEQRSKQGPHINHKLLQQEIVFTNKGRCCQGLFDCFGYYFNFGGHTNAVKKRHSTSIFSLDNMLEMYFTDTVDIGTKSTQYEIEWVAVKDLISKNTKSTLFENYNPFDIHEQNLALSNHLIIMQALSQHPWLLRRIIQPDQQKHGFYNVQLYPEYRYHRVGVDHHLPVLKHSQQLMFLSDENEPWPMLIQKALAKRHGSYFSLVGYQARSLVTELTGFYTQEMALSHCGNSFEFLQQITDEGYFLVLKGRSDSPLKDSNKTEVDYYSILNFHCKGGKRMVLINCPFEDSIWKEKEKYEPLPLKIIKSHYAMQDQMSVWVDEAKLTDYFENIIYSCIRPNYERFDLTFKAHQEAYLKFIVRQEREENVLLMLVRNDLQQVINLNQVSKDDGQCYLNGWVNEGDEKLHLLPPDKHQQHIAHLPTAAGEYLLRYCFEETTEQSSTGSSIKQDQTFTLVIWSIDCIQVDLLEESFASAQWFACFKNHCKTNWGSHKYLVEYVCGSSLVLMKENADNVYLSYEGLASNTLLEGNFKEYGAIELLQEDGEFFYAVVRQDLRGKKLSFYYEEVNPQST